MTRNRQRLDAVTKAARQVADLQPCTNPRCPSKGPEVWVSFEGEPDPRLTEDDPCPVCGARRLHHIAFGYDDGPTDDQ